jgi:hypothetical protein
MRDDASIPRDLYVSGLNLRRINTVDIMARAKIGQPTNYSQRSV